MNNDLPKGKAPIPKRLEFNEFKKEICNNLSFEMMRKMQSRGNMDGKIMFYYRKGLTVNQALESIYGHGE